MLLCIKIRIPKKIFNLIWYPFFPKKDSTNEPSGLDVNKKMGWLLSQSIFYEGERQREVHHLSLALANKKALSFSTESLLNSESSFKYALFSREELVRTQVL